MGSAYLPDCGARLDVERSENEKDMFALSYLLRPKFVREALIAEVEVGIVACCGNAGMVVVEPDWRRGRIRDEDFCDNLEPTLGVIAL